MCSNHYSTSITEMLLLVVFIVLLIIPTRSRAFLTSTTTTSTTTTTSSSFQYRMQFMKQSKMIYPLEQVSFWENRHTTNHHHFRKPRYSRLYPKMSFSDSFTHHKNDNDDDIITSTSTSESNDEYAYITKVRECIQELSDIEGIDYVKEWNDSIEIISTLMHDDPKQKTTFRMEQIESCLAQAWNWKRYVIITSPMARKFIQTIPPNSTMIRSSIQWLQHANELQFSNETILQGIIESPETYLLQPQISYYQAIQIAPQPYTNNVIKFRELIQQYPSALQYTFNCIDTGCKSECGQCWVSFQYQMSEQRKQTL